MSLEGLVDLNQELADLFKKEEMLAFFDFRLVVSEGETLSGLCKISRPKAGEGASTYLSLLSVTDVPEGSTWALVDGAMAAVGWEQIKRHLACVESVMSMPIRKPIKGVYLRETYVYLSAAPGAPLESYLENRLYPAIVKATGFEAGDLVIWSDMAETARDTAGRSSTEKRPPPAFMQRLKGILS
jgi:hypothetical protein